MRISDQLMSDNGIRNISDNLEKLYQLQIKAETGKRYTKPSDNPAVAAAGLTLRSTMQVSQAYTDTAKSTQAWMDATESALQNMSDLMTRAHNLALEGLDDSKSTSQRQAMATELDGILKQAVDIGNTQHLDRYIFAGYATKTKPFTLNDPPTAPATVSSVTYNGDSNVIKRDIGPGEEITASVNGETAFINSNLFSTLITIRDALNDPAQLTNLRTATAQLEQTSEQVTDTMTAHGARMRHLTITLDKMEQTTLDIKSLLSQKEEVNMAEVLSQLKNQEVVYQATLEVSGRTSAMMNLFDYLQ